MPIACTTKAFSSTVYKALILNSSDFLAITQGNIQVIEAASSRVVSLPSTNVAHRESQEAWQAAFDKLQLEEFTKQIPFEQIPALYEVAVHLSKQ